MSIMNRLKDMREDRDLSQKEVAEILGILQSDYSKYELRNYSREVISEMQFRGYKVNIENHLKYFEGLGVDFHNDYMPRFKEHNKQYLTICYWNLGEKYLRGQKDFTTDIWNKIDEFYKKEMMNESNND